MPSKEDFLEKLREIVDTVKGRKEIKTRVAVLANPDNLKTMSILKRNQVDFVVDAYWLAKEFPFFKPMRDYADEILETNCSIEGKRSEQVISFVQAFILNKLGEIRLKGEQKEK